MSSGEVLLTLIVALLVFGPTKLPMLARHLGLVLCKINRVKEQIVLFLQEQERKYQLDENIQRAQRADKIYKERKS